MPQKVWTPERDALLRSLYPVAGAAEVARQLGLPLYGVKSRAQKIGVRGCRSRRRVWTAGLDARLRASFAGGGVAAAHAALPHLTRAAVKNRAQQLGLRHPERFWTPDEDAYLREHYGRSGHTAAACARVLGRGVPATQRRVGKLGLLSERTWTAGEREAVRSGYAARGAAALARELLGADDDVSLKAVRHLAFKLGVTTPARHPSHVRARVRELHGRGLNDRQIAAEMADYFTGRNAREAVTAVRRRLGLPKQKQDGAALVAKQLAAVGAAHPMELKARAHRAFAARYGLPEGLTVRQVQIVLALAVGPRTKPELQSELGLTSWALNRPKPGSGRPDPGVSGSYLSDLERRGLAVSVRLRTHRGARRRYALTPLALTLLSQAKERTDGSERVE